MTRSGIGSWALTVILAVMFTSIIATFALLITNFWWGIYATAIMSFVASMKFVRDELKEQDL